MIRIALLVLLAVLPTLARAQRWSHSPAPRGEALLRNAVLASHNRERATHGAKPLRWSDVLVAHATAYAGVLARREVLEHDPAPGRRKVEGE
ncbi:MAG: serine protease, partial [Sphingomonas sp.]|nr:serine protease [Sphingomonas sp.]